MSTISEALNKYKEDLMSGLESAAPRAILSVVDQLRSEFLAQQELAESDRRLAPPLFDLMCARLQQQNESLSTAAEPIKHHGRISSATIAVARVQLALAVTLVLSIVVNITALSLLLALGIGLICYLVASGQWEALSKTGAVSWLLRFVGPHETPKVPDSLAVEQGNTEHARNIALTLQEMARLADSVLAGARYLLDSSTMAHPGRPNLSQPVLEFLQDLSEAASTVDGDFALKVAQKRLGAVADALGIRILEYSPDTSSHFAVEVVSDTLTENRCITVRPALMRGEACLARGYAKVA